VLRKKKKKLRREKSCRTQTNPSEKLWESSMEKRKMNKKSLRGEDVNGRRTGDLPRAEDG